MSKQGAEGGPSGVPTYASGATEEQTLAEQLQEYQLEHADLWFEAIDAVRHETQRAILTALQDGMGGCTYDELYGWCSVSKRTVRKHVTNLENAGLVQRVNSRSHAVSYASHEAETLVSHALDCYYS
jgi:predicted transcriptional regulator